jgi:hypothetical protein
MVAELTVPQVFQASYVAFAQGHRLPDYVRRAAWAILACRTAVLGGHTQRCPDGHFQRIWYHSCTHRMCPPCAWLQVERWLRRQHSNDPVIMITGSLLCWRNYMGCGWRTSRP